MKDKTKVVIFLAAMSMAYASFAWALTAVFQLEVDSPHATKALVAELEAKLKQKKSVADEGHLNKLVQQNASGLDAILKSHGFYAAKIEHELKKKNNDSYLVTYKVDANNVFTITDIEVKHSPSTKGISTSQLKIKTGDSLIAKNVIQTAKDIAQYIEKHNCFTETVVEHQAILDFEEKKASLLFNVADRPQVEYGHTEIVGLDTVDREYILRQIPWQQGQCFKVRSIKQLEKSLRETSLFSHVEVTYPLEPNNQNQIPLTVKVHESLHRTIKIGVGYESDNGPGIYSAWVHRNYFGQGEIFETSLKLSPVSQQLKANYLNPFFFKPSQSLSTDILFERIDTHQYDSISLEGEANIHRKLTNNWSTQYGVGYRLSQVKEGVSSDNYGLNYYPLSISYDSRDNILDSRQGSYFKLGTAPYWDTLGNSSEFLKSSLELSKYLYFGKDKYTVLAARLAAASIVGAPLTQVPADIRLYAGGGKSVRGYEYQSLGQGPDAVVPGGRSLFEVSAEIRQQLNDTYGVVLFIDGGNIYQETLPTFSPPLRWAVGGGLRYYTSFGPLRFDVATPIDRREGIDSAFQIYISIGQSF